jgi:hypothetical protein
MTREAVARVEVTYVGGRVEAWEDVWITRGASRLVRGRVESPECSTMTLPDSKRVEMGRVETEDGTEDLNWTGGA